MTQLFQKIGRRYVPWGDGRNYDSDMMKAGQFRLTYCSAQGSSRYEYEVKPDTAGFVAASMIARGAMEDSIREAAIGGPADGVSVPYTKRQLEILERFRAEMSVAGGLWPSWWTVSSPREISQAGIDAVRNWAP
jgi:hypothetical protein